MTIVPTTKTGGCGCGGGQCGCGPGEALSYATNFSRPRFFAGQLLTEDDLRRLDDYVVGKNRLHNRHFFGDGVVCGLGVYCHVCDDGKVVVEPGYALDCCGNDIVVPCEAELDVLQMIQELRMELGGASCGDPCAEGEDGKKDGATRQYCLYVRYAETLEDPVAPYATDQTCDGPCEPTRVVEGYRFELRCGPHEGQRRPNVLTAILDCIDDFPKLSIQAAKALDLQRLGGLFAQSATISRDELTFDFTEDHATDLDGLQATLAEADLAPTTAEQAYVLTENVRRARQLVALSGDPDQWSAVAEVTNNMQADDVVALMSEADRAEAAACLRPMAASADEVDDRTLTLARMGVIVDRKARSDVTRKLASVREWLLTRIEKSGSLTSCRLREELLAIDIEPRTDSERFERAFSDAVERLIRVFFRYLVDCVCAAFNPPCPPCEDEAVLLACLDVKDCQVIDICNQARSWVLTPTAVRYWLGPPIDLIGRALEFLCCQFDLKLKAKDPKAVTIDGIERPVAVGYDYRRFDHRAVAPASDQVGDIGQVASLGADLDPFAGGVWRTATVGHLPDIRGVNLGGQQTLLEALSSAGSSLGDWRKPAGVRDAPSAEMADAADDRVAKLERQLASMKGQNTTIRNRLDALEQPKPRKK